MSGVTSPAATWSIEKTITLTHHSKHNHTPSPVAPGFAAPLLSPSLAFSPVALAGAIARTATMRNAPFDLLASFAKSVLLQLRCLIADGPVFALSPHHQHLVDIEGTLFAARVGAGITDLYMNSLGYAWRDNAEGLSSRLEPHADFIYEGGRARGHGVVLAEAHGSFSPRTSDKSVTTQSQRKYKRQVKPYVATTSPLHGKIIHGYSVAFGSTPGTSDAFLSIAETRIKKPRGKTIAAPGMVQPEAGLTPTSIALTTHRSNFLLMGALPIVEWIDWARGTADLPRNQEPVVFLRVQYAGQRFLASPFSIYQILPQRWSDELWEYREWCRYFERSSRSWDRVEPFFSGWFVMAETAAGQFLNTLSAIIRTGRENLPLQLELPVFQPAGFGFANQDTGEREPSRYVYAQYRDGLALLETPSGHPVDDIRIWSPKDGFHPSEP